MSRVAALCLVMYLALAANVTYIQGIVADTFANDPRNRRASLERFEDPRGDIMLADGTLLATSVKMPHGPYGYRREYPAGPVYAPITGHVSIYGTSGLEHASDALLAGRDPRLRLANDDGASLVLTLDEDAQLAAYQALAKTGGKGAAVAMDPRTGAILALVSHPSYDPNEYATFDSAALAATDRRLRADPDQPLLNRAIGQNYPPGSTFKVITAAAALANGESESGYCGSSLTEAFARSCNAAFSEMATAIGSERLLAQAREFGFNDDSLTIPLPVARSVFPASLDQSQLAMAAIGQYDDRVTPLMEAMMSAAVAYEGALMRPYLVAEARGSDGRVLEHTRPVRYRRPMSASIAARLTEMMIAVTRQGGTGTAAATPGIAVAAKTGTAENVPGAPAHAVFTCFAPADAPTVAVGVLLEEAGSGGEVAAPIARRIIEALL